MNENKNSMIYNHYLSIKMLEFAFYKIYVAIVPTYLFFVISPR